MCEQHNADLPSQASDSDGNQRNATTPDLLLRVRVPRTVYCVRCTVYCTPMISPARSTTIALNLSITLPFAPTSVRSTQLGALPFVHARTESEGASVVVVELLLTHADMLVLTR
jgi:hypothetical protein